VNHQAELSRAFDISNVNLVSTDARLYMAEKYDTDYGIYDHINDRDPHTMKVVAHHDCEDTVKISPLFDRIAQFEERKVAEKFGCSIFELLAQPTYIVEEIMRISLVKQEKIDKEASAFAALQKKLEQQR